MTLSKLARDRQSKHRANIYIHPTIKSRLDSARAAGSMINVSAICNRAIKEWLDEYESINDEQNHEQAEQSERDETLEFTAL